MSIINADGSRFYVAIAFMGGDGADWLASIHRAAGDAAGPLTLSYRFRYYRDDKVEGSRDRKNFWTATFPDGDEAKALAILRQGAEELQRHGFGNYPPDVLELRTADAETIFHALVARPWAHVLGMSKGGAT